MKHHFLPVLSAVMKLPWIILVDGCATLIGTILGSDGGWDMTGISSDNAVIRSKVDRTMIWLGFILDAWS